MSKVLYARPAPTNVPEPEVLYNIKHRLARYLGLGDGSLRTPVVTLSMTIDPSLMPWLQGLHEGVVDDDTKKDVRRMMELLADNPQGVEVWIDE